MARELTGNQSGVSEKSRTRTQQPPLFRVLMHNDDYTTMEFVVEVLQKVFHKSATEANRIMLHIHHQGTGVCGTFPFEIAETRVAQVHRLARQSGFPLRCSLEEA
ncbi:MAG: ATP-dependent Clp protease adapter ClpS [Geothermobacteraceae bacterium]